MKKRWVVLGLTGVFLWAVAWRFAVFAQVKTPLAQAQWNWVLLALLAQVAAYLVTASSYQAAFFAAGLRARMRDLIPVTLASLLINVTVPAGGAGRAALFVLDFSRRGLSETGAATGVRLQRLADLGAFGLLLLPGLIYLYSERSLTTPEALAAGFLLLIALVLAGGLLRRALPLADTGAQPKAQAAHAAGAAAVGRPFRLIWAVGLAGLARLVDLFTLYLLFRAFNQAIGAGPLLAGYALSLLLGLITITPQGIGVVEGLMVVTFTGLGLPGSVALLVALAFRGLSFWLPMALGLIALQRLRPLLGRLPRRTEIWGVRLAAVLVALMGVINVLSAVTPALGNRLRLIEQLSPLEVRHGGHLTAALAGFALLSLARSLGRRKRVAWLLTLGVLAISALSHLVKGLDYEAALLAGGLGVLLWLMRAQFHARSDRPSIQQGLVVAAGSGVFTLAYGVIGFYLLDRHFNITFGFWTALRQTVVMFTQFYDPGLTPMTHFGRFFATSIYLVGAATLGYAGLMLLRPVFMRDPATRQEHALAQVIVEKYGHSSLARYLLFDDKRYFFTPGGSVIGFALIGRAAITLGDPVGPPEDLLPSIQAFTEVCHRNDWLPAFYQTLPETLAIYKQAGFDALGIGEEASVNLPDFTLAGKDGKPLRAPLNKLTAAGYTCVIHQPPISEALLDELRGISDEWLTMRRGSEKRFALGWFDDGYIRHSLIGAVHAPGGWISAFANLVPEYQTNEIAIDLMRHRQETENGTMEFLFVSLFQWAKAQGYQRFSLGLSALSGVGDRSEDPTIERMLHFIYEHVNQFYNFKGLHSFKEKFRPDWVPRYLIYAGTANLAQTWLAVVQAHLGGGNLLTQHLPADSRWRPFLRQRRAD